MASEDLVEFALLHAEGWNDHTVAGADHRSRRKLALDAVCDLHDRVAFHFQDWADSGAFAVEPTPDTCFTNRCSSVSGSRVDGITALETNDAKAALSSFFQVMPVGRNPDRILFLRYDSELADRCREHHRPALVDQRGPFSRRANGLEDDRAVFADIDLVLGGGNED